MINGQALCPPCNLLKGNTVGDELRSWQREAARHFAASRATDFLVCATPGAGKTLLALTLARRLIDQGDAERVAVVVPTDSLRQQWVAEAHAVAGFDLMPVKSAEDYDKAGYHGCVVTYQQLARGAGSDLLRKTTRRKTVALLDELHHAGDDRSWGDAARYALEHAVRRIGLTGTPWRENKASPIPFVTYDEQGKVVVDHAYEYGAAVADGVCRRIEFHAYDGEARWIDCGRTVSAQLGEELSSEDTPMVLDTILDPNRDWMPGILRAAAEALRELRTAVPDAGGLVIAERQWQAYEYARQLQEITGEPAIVAVSDDPEASTRIEEFRQGRSSWLVAVRMVSEGVDIKRLAVGVYAAKARTPLFFRQVVGRFVRTRAGEEINARLFIPAIPAFTDHAKAIEDELRHQLDLERERHEKAAREAANSQQTFEMREPLSASEARFSSSIFAGAESSAELHAKAVRWCQDRGIPAMYAPNVINDVRVEQAPVYEATVTPQPPKETRVRREKMLRGEIATLVGKLSYRTGVEPQTINADLLRQGFPPRGQCSIAELERERELLADWLGRL